MKLKEAVPGLITLILLILGVFFLLSKASHPQSVALPINRNNAPTTNQANPQSSPNTVTVQDFAFKPSSITVKKGTTITWTNQDDAHHTVTADAGSPEGGPSSQLLAKGQTYSLTFNTVGTYKYHCEPHPYMHGTVIVTE